VSSNPSLCRACQHLVAEEVPAGRTDPGPVVRSCTAFPAGIPLGIALAGFDHRHAFSGDRGIRFKQGPTLAQAEAFDDWSKEFGEG